jgi:hypothetical protein
LIQSRKKQLWNSKKPIFCWDGEINLEIISKHLVHFISKQFSNCLISDSDLVNDIKIRSFTKSDFRPNLLVFLIDFNPRYKHIIEQKWQCGSPSNYFKFKIDLMKNNSISLWNQFKEREDDLEIQLFNKSSSRYNFSQAIYKFTCRLLNAKNINLMIHQKIKKNSKVSS